MKVTYVGHSTVLAELDGVRLLTDPVLRQHVVHLRRRGPAVDTSLLQKVDAILISHLHYDHLDIPSLRMLDRSTPVIVPTGAGSLIQRAGFDNVAELATGASHVVGGVAITATHSEHYVKRHPFAPVSAAAGFLVSGSQRFYFAGDTDLFEGMEELAPALDLALLPVWGWGASLGPGHLSPERAAMSLEFLDPCVAVPIHWGTLSPLGKSVKNNSWLRDPPHEFARLAERSAPGVDVQVLSPGEALDLPVNQD